ncbi:L,D-transpeptidase [Streptomyces sp. NBC_00487]|uniref:L,D-transpeptidase n=1 Tax=unclassified Streptomyces TaxID=2593676 RepID=UPI002DDB0452|nr:MULTISPECIES: L,D-transpeptidase [unclassified Streptomyces]WRZ01514.1 L,D-transpeptidase [Streptomyces sp. NBC_00481]
MVAVVSSALLGWTAVPAAASAPAAACTARTGPYQWDLERHLKLPADGRQSTADCVAIRAFQQRTGVKPANGYANVATHRTMLVVRARADPNAAGKCPVRSYQVTCVDLDQQLVWVQRGKRVIYAPVPARTGKDGQETRSGWHTVYWKNRDHHSDLYDHAPMPFAQFFSDGQAFHGVLDDLFQGGSHGCVNLRYADAERLWRIMHKGDSVYVWGVKPGTGRSLRPSSASSSAAEQG